MQKDFPFLAVAIVVVALWISVPAVVLYFNDHLSAGEIGDTFNIVSSLFSALAFVGVVYALYLQRLEMHESRRSRQEELRISLESSRLQTVSFLIDTFRAELVERSSRLKIAPRSVTELEDYVSKVKRGIYTEQPDDIEDVVHLAEKLVSLQRSLEVAYDNERFAQTPARRSTDTRAADPRE